MQFTSTVIYVFKLIVFLLPTSKDQGFPLLSHDKRLCLRRGKAKITTVAGHSVWCDACHSFLHCISCESQPIAAVSSYIKEVKLWKLLGGHSR